MKIGNNEKAWNDPPMFAYQPTSAGSASSDSTNSNVPASKRTVLNKRVAFPMSGNSSMTSKLVPAASAGPPLIPPLSMAAPPTFFSPSSPSQISDLATAPDITSTVVHNAENFKAELSFVKETFNSTFKTLQNKEKQEELDKRIQSLYTCWEEGKLNDNIQNRLLKLCQHMKNKEYVAADILQVSLAVDYTAECSPWILAVKSLLTSLTTETS